MNGRSGASGGPSKGMLAAGALVLVILLGLGFCLTTRFSLINKDEAVKASWANVAVVYQRRADLIPNLVNTVKGAAKFEATTHQNVIEAQNKLLAIHKEFQQSVAKEDPSQLDRQYAQLLEASKRFLDLSVVAFPNLKSVEAFTTLQAQLEGSENRIAVERRNYNLAVQSYNAAVRKWSWLPLCGGFPIRESFFEAKLGAEDAPTVNFN